MLKNAGLQGNTLSSHRMTTGFGPFDLWPTTERAGPLPTDGLFLFERSPALGWLSQRYEYTVAKQNGGGAEWVELLLY